MSYFARAQAIAVEYLIARAAAGDFMQRKLIESQRIIA